MAKLNHIADHVSNGKQASIENQTEDSANRYPGSEEFHPRPGFRIRLGLSMFLE
jgi:hypothetical protein